MLAVWAGPPPAAHEIEAAASAPPTSVAELRTEPIVIPVVYDGPDLAAIAATVGLSVESVIARHTAIDYRVGFIGFLPGFAYLVGDDGALHLPRRDNPRAEIPAGSVALGGEYCAVYPRASPGGWHLLGMTTATVRRGPHTAGAAGARNAGAVCGGGRMITVVDPGALTTVQDEGRPGFAHLGVPPSGALDRPALARANALVGNAAGAAGLECTLRGPTLRFERTATIALTGAPMPVRRNGTELAHDTEHDVAAGDELRVGTATTGVRGYLAVSGGINVAATLGSRATDTLSGLGPPPLAAGHVLPIGPVPSRREFLAPAASNSRLDGAVVTLGPRDDRFAADAITALTSEPFTVSPTSNRIGLRLTGPELAYASDTELRSEGLVLGAIQVPPNGQPIVMLADHPTTGGYPVIGVVAAADLPLLAQLRPGAQLRLRWLSRAAPACAGHPAAAWARPARCPSG